MTQLFSRLALLIVMCGFCQHAHAENLGYKSPFPSGGTTHTQPALDQDFKCRQPPPPPKDLKIESFYSDENSSIIDNKAYIEYKKSVYSINKFENTLNQMANIYTQDNNATAAAICTQNWLYDWARNDAMLGRVSANGEYIRKWVLASAAAAYLQIQNEVALDNAKTQRIESWLKNIATHVIVDFSTQSDRMSRQNNHLYWAAWGVGLAAVVNNDPAMFKWAMEKARFGLAQIQKDGTLPHEMSRKSRALHYHVFAIMPLVMLAELAEVNGQNLYNYNHRRLHTLIKRGDSGD